METKDQTITNLNDLVSLKNVIINQQTTQIAQLQSGMQSLHEELERRQEKISELQKAAEKVELEAAQGGAE